MVAVLVITLGCSVKWKRIQVQQVLLAVISDGSQAVPKEKFPAPESGVQTSLPGSVSVLLVTYSSPLSYQGY